MAGTNSDAKTSANISIFEALVMNDRERLEQLLSTDSGQFVHQLAKKDSLGRTPVYWAAQNGNVELLEMLIDRSADIEAGDKDNWTALFIACLNGHIACVRRLLQERPKLNNKESKNEWSPLFAAAWNGHTDIATLLLDNKAKYDLRDNQQRTPIYVAAMRGNSQLVKLLIEKGADVNAQDSSNRSPLYIATQLGHIDTVRVLTEHENTDLDRPDCDKRSPLAIALRTGGNEIAKLLIDCGANGQGLEKELKKKIMGDSDNRRGTRSGVSLPCKGKVVGMKEISPAVKLYCMAVLGEEQIWGGGSDGSILVFDRKTNKHLAYAEKMLQEAIIDIVVIEELVWAVTNTMGISVLRWHGQSKKKSDTIYNKKRIKVVHKLQPKQTLFCCFHHSEHVYAGSENVTLYQWNILTFQEVTVKLDVSAYAAQMREHEKFIRALRYIKGLFYVVIKNVIFIYDRNWNYVDLLRGHREQILNMTYAKQNLWTSSKDNSVRVWSIKTRQCLREYKGINTNCLQAIGSTQILLGGFDAIISSYDAETLEEVEKFPQKHQREIICMCWAGRSLWVASLDKTVTIWK